MLKLCWTACVLSIVLSAQFAVARSTEVTVSDLSRHAQEFDGQFVQIQAVLVFGWEGDNFLLDPSRPRPVSMPSRDPASVWFYCKPGHEQEVYGRIGHERVVYGSFGGYFHFASKTHIVNGVFEPGPLQFEAVEVSIPEQQPRSLAAATTLGDVDETRRILQANESVRAQYGSTLLFLAAQFGRADFVQELLASGADPKFVAPGGDTSLMMAAWGCKLEVAEALLDHGALVNAANNNGETALIFASQTCPDGRLVHLLLADGADPNAKGNDGGTALRAAAGNPMVVEKLLAAGADPTVKDKYGNTVESESCDRGEKGHYQVCQLVRDALRNAAAN
jgi:hypothetical protein